MRGRRRSLSVLLCGAALLAAGCSSAARQDAGEPQRNYTVELVHASFAAEQSIARETNLVLAVRNSGSETMPNVAVTLNSLEYVEHYPELASNKRPIWAIEQGPGAIPNPPVQSVEVAQPGGGQTAYVNTWALGPLAPGRTRVFAWHLMPVKAGAYSVHFVIAAGLAGKSRATLAGGGPVRGVFNVHIAGKPPVNHVNPKTGKVEPGPFPPPS